MRSLDWKESRTTGTAPQRFTKRCGSLPANATRWCRKERLPKNQLHAEQAEAEPHTKSIARIQQRIALFDTQDKEIQRELQAMIKEDKEMKAVVILLCSLPGVGLLITAAIVLAETNGFELIRNKRQLASYAGFDVREKESGTSVKGKPKISKRGEQVFT